MPVCRRLVSVPDPEQGRLVERFGAELDAQRQNRRTGSETARQHDGGNASHVGDVKLMVDLVTPVPGSVSVIFAPDTTAPVWSETMPVTSELACANAPAHASTKNNGNTKNLYLVCIM